ncbi:hypothetical protein V6N13_098737 [Hibiscus sabdariffa]
MIGSLTRMIVELCRWSGKGSRKIGSMDLLSSAKGMTVFEVAKGKSLFNIEWKDMFTRTLLDREYAVVKEVSCIAGSYYGGNACSGWDRQKGLADSMVVSEVRTMLIVCFLKLSEWKGGLC